MASRKREAEGARGLAESAIKNNAKLLYVAAALVILAAIAFAYSSFPKSSYQSCASIVYQNQRETCVQSLAESTGNYTLCNSLQSQAGRYQCIQTAAERKLDLSGCAILNSSGSYPYFANCVYNVTAALGDVNGCMALNESSQAYCVISAEARGGFSTSNDCYLISNSTIENSCLSVYYYRQASLTGNPSYCGMANDSRGIGLDEALIYLNNTAIDNYSDFYYGQNLTLNDYCYAAAAYTAGSNAVCSGLTGERGTLCNTAASSRNIQISNVTGNFTQIEEACSLANSTTRSLCMDLARTTQAINTRNASECGMVSSEVLKNSCYGGLAYAYNDSSYCTYITNSTLNSKCVGIVLNETGSG